MKKIFLVFLVNLFVYAAFAQTRTEVQINDLKKEITNSVAKDFAGYKIDRAFRVDKGNDIVFHVIVSKERSRMTLVYDKNGAFVKKIEPPKKTELKVAELKKEVTDNITKDYPGYTIMKAVKVEDNEAVTYHINLTKENERLNLLYDKDWKFIKKVEQGKGPNMRKDNMKPEENKK
jgi:hypothetical protein